MKKSVIVTFFALSSIFLSENLQAQNAITYWKDGEPTIIYSPDSVFFWNGDNLIPDSTGENDEGGVVELTEIEEYIKSLPSDEEETPTITYSEEDSLRYDDMAKEVLALFAASENAGSRRLSEQEEEELAEEAIRKNGNNIFIEPEDGGVSLKIEQQNWNSGQWGKTRYGGFETYYNTFSEHGKRYLLVVFRSENGAGFPNKKTAYLKLGQVNSGEILVKKNIYPGKEYATLVVCISEYLPNYGYGCVNFFPLLITDSNGARNYLNPIFVKSNPIVPKGWENFSYGRVFGWINGVPVRCNTSDSRNQGVSGDYQCVELCKRYVTNLYPDIKRPYESIWGHAWNWPENRRDENGQDKGKYIVFANGSRQVREGDLIVGRWQYYNKKTEKMEWTGHIGVVIKTEKDHISIAHQNGGDGTYAYPIGTKIVVDNNGVVKDYNSAIGKSPIYQTSKPITHFIRRNHSSEEEEEVKNIPLLSASTTNIEFGEVEVGKNQTMTFRIKNTGTSVLTISSIELSKGKNFSTDGSGCALEPNETKSFTVTFTPTAKEEYMDRLVILSDADDNPEWIIHLNGIGYRDTPSVNIPTEGLVAYYPFNGNANDESGNGNHGILCGKNVPDLTTDRFGKSNCAYEFGGYYNFNYIRVPNSETLMFDKQMTISFWIEQSELVGMDGGWGYYSTTDAEFCAIAKAGDGNATYPGLYIITSRGSNGEGLGVSTNNSNGNSHNHGNWNHSISYSKNDYQLGSWLHVALVVDNTEKILYLDGVEVARDELNREADFSSMNAHDLFFGIMASDNMTLGGYGSGAWYPFYGKIDDVRIYSKALNASEINSLYREP